MPQAYHAEHVDPFDESNPFLWMKLEHLGRYYFAADILKVRQRGRHLDLGCATGYGLRELIPVSSLAVGLDYDPVLLEAAVHLEGRDVHLVRGDLDVESLVDVMAAFAPLDSVTAFEFFEHLEDPGRTLRQLRECVGEGALLIASVPNAKYEVGVLPDPHHHTTFGPGEFAALLEDSGFCVEKTLGQGTINRIKRRETSLVRKGRFEERPSALPAMHGADSIRKLALLLAYPDSHDLDFTYSHLFLARAI